MKTHCVWLASLGIVLASTTLSLARPEYGSNCAICHSTPVTGRMSLSGETTTTDLGTRLDLTTPGPLKTYNVSPGGTVVIKENILNGSDHYAVSIRNFEQGGQKNNSNNLLSYSTPNLAANGWTQYQDGGSGATYFSTSIVADGSTPTFNFELLVSAGTPADYYDLALTFGAGAGQFSQEEHVYLNVVPEPQAYAMASGFASAAFVAYRRWCRRSRTGR